MVSGVENTLRNADPKTFEHGFNTQNGFTTNAFSTTQDLTMAKRVEDQRSKNNSICIGSINDQQTRQSSNLVRPQSSNVVRNGNFSSANSTKIVVGGNTELKASKYVVN